MKSCPYCAYPGKGFGKIHILMRDENHNPIMLCPNCRKSWTQLLNVKVEDGDHGTNSSQHQD